MIPKVWCDQTNSTALCPTNEASQALFGEEGQAWDVQLSAPRAVDLSPCRGNILCQDHTHDIGTDVGVVQCDRAGNHTSGFLRQTQAGSKTFVEIRDRFVRD